MALNDSDFQSIIGHASAENIADKGIRKDRDLAAQADALKKYLQAQKEGSVGADGAFTPGTDSLTAKAKISNEIDQLSNPKLRQFLNPGGSLKVGDLTAGAAPREAAGMGLTPAQKAAETAAGKKIADFEGGGQQAAESNIGQIQGVQKELQGGDRDAWDQRVGGALENHPTLMSMFAPKEKARRDAVQNAMLTMLHDAGIPRPTQWDIQRVFGQVYDPASDDKTNMARMQQAVSKMTSHKQAMEGMANNYHASGYATIGNNPQQQAPQQAPAPQGGAPDEAAEFQNFYNNIYKKMKPNGAGQ